MNALNKLKIVIEKHWFDLYGRFCFAILLNYLWSS